MLVFPDATTLGVSCVIDAPAERVFRAWTDPDVLVRWFMPLHGYSARAELDVRVGGRFHVAMRATPEVRTIFNPSCVGTYVKVEPNHRLAFTLRWEGIPIDAGDSLVTVHFRDSREGTDLDLVHERNSSTPLRDFHQVGWTHCLERLTALLGPDARGECRGG